MKNVLSSAVNVQFIYSQINSLLASSDSSNAVLAALHSCGGVATSAALQMQLGLSQPTVSRALAPLIRSGDVRALGAARSRFYLLPRSIDGVGREVPIMRVDAHGLITPFAGMGRAGGCGWTRPMASASRMTACPGF